jgi:hypothetical protein
MSGNNYKICGVVKSDLNAFTANGEASSGFNRTVIQHGIQIFAQG